MMDFCFPKGKTMQRATADKSGILAQEIKRQASAGLMRTYAASLPLYTVSQGLEKLEAAERALASFLQSFQQHRVRLISNSSKPTRSMCGN
jgi:hypothetical protein